MRDIARYPLIQLARGSSVRKHLDVALGAAAPPPVFEVEHLATVTGLVRAGLGVSVVPAMTLFHFGGEDLRIVPLAGRADATAAGAARGAQPVGGGAGLGCERDRRAGGPMDGHRPYIMLSSAWVT